MNLKNRMVLLAHERDVLEKYLEAKIYARDWHAIADVACDIRELEAQIKLLKSLVYIEEEEQELENK